MNQIESKLITIDELICKNISKFNRSERGLLSTNILQQLRNYVEHISLIILANGGDIENSWENIKKANTFVQINGNLSFITKFHKLLQISVSHYSPDEENSERLMLKYYEYLIRIKSFLKNNYGLDVLKNINEFPLQIESNMKEFYEKIAEKINQSAEEREKSIYNDRYYIQKIKPFFVKDEVYYEVIFTRADDYISKYDRIIAFTKLDVSYNYSVKLSVSYDKIDVLGKMLPVKIIDNCTVSIRPCELDNFAKIFGYYQKISNTIECDNFMNILTLTRMNIVDIIDLPEESFENIKQSLSRNTKVQKLSKTIQKCREISINKKKGYNVMRYLLFRMNNKIIKKQAGNETCDKLSGLKLLWGCIPFDQMPFNSSLKNHNPKLLDLLNCLDIDNRKHEFLARIIKNNTELKGQLYTPKNELTQFENIDDLVKLWNDSLYSKHGSRRLEIYKGYIYIAGYEQDTCSIIFKLKQMALKGIKNYSSFVESWLSKTANKIDCSEKEDALKKMFQFSKVGLIYGSAGTGKSTMISHISNCFKGNSKLLLANTNTAVDNLKQKVNSANCSFLTINKYLRNATCDFDLLIIDECSTISNSDMLKILIRENFKLIVLVGDVFQIESIRFGNWFSIIRSFLPPSSVFELTKPYRSNNQNLLKFWNMVRCLDDKILELMVKNEYSISIDESIFLSTGEDEITLCLNYDGFYGINNINRLLQSNNDNKYVEWGTEIYKVNDPVIFNEANRFSPLIYNNLKGRIHSIKKSDKMIEFEVEIELVINGLEATKYDFQLMDNADNGNSVIKISIDKYETTDEDELSLNSVVPFQVAYALSIHKAQGLEYKSVKIVVTEDVEDQISHNIFYTAITRARENLKIYWTPETGDKILKNLVIKNNQRDISLLKSRNQL